MKALKTINEAIFGYGSPVTIGLMRLFIGGLAFMALSLLAVDFGAWFTETGYVPIEVGRGSIGGLPRIDLIGGVTDTGLTFAFFVLVWLSALFTAVGLWTRVSSIVLLIGITSLHHRNIGILNSGDTLLRALLLYVAVAPSGKAVSVDRLIGLWKGTAPEIPEQVSLWPQRLVQFQLAVVYLATVWHKWGGGKWRDGTATWYPVQLQEFDRFWFPEWLDSQMWFIKANTYGTLVVELALATLVFAKPLRKWVLLGGILLHAGIEYRMNIPLFSAIITSAYISHYSGDETSDWARRMGDRLKRFRLTIPAKEGAQANLGAKRVAHAVDPLGLVVLDPKAPASLASRPVLGSLLRSFGAWPLWLWIPGWRAILEAAGAKVEVAKNVRAGEIAK